MNVGTRQGYHPDTLTHPGSVKHYNRHGVDDKPDWMLCPQVFLAIVAAFKPLDVNLFTSRLTQ